MSVLSYALHCASLLQMYQQKHQPVVMTEVISHFGKVGGRKARPNANFQLFETQKREVMDAGVYFLCSLHLQNLNKLEHMQGRKSPVNSL